jgi:uncharacterized protein
MSAPHPFEIISRHYPPGGILHHILVVHSVLVAQKAREIAREFLERNPGADLDVDFVVEAALLHDIGIKHCHAPEIHCEGSEPYVRHGVLGKEMLEREGFPRHALVCARHTGSGLTRGEVRAQRLPLPDDDYLPVSLEEKVICVADKFYSKKPHKLWKEKKASAIEKGLAKYGAASLDRWHELASEILHV